MQLIDMIASLEKRFIDLDKRQRDIEHMLEVDKNLNQNISSILTRIDRIEKYLSSKKLFKI